MQEYTLIKMRVLELKGKLAGLEGQGPVFLMAATLRCAGQRGALRRTCGRPWGID